MRVKSKERAQLKRKERDREKWKKGTEEKQKHDTGRERESAEKVLADSVRIESKGDGEHP